MGNVAKQRRITIINGTETVGSKQACTRAQAQHAEKGDAASVLGRQGKAVPLGDIVLRGHAGAASGRVARLAEPGKDWMGPNQKNAKPEPWEGNR